MAAWAGAVIQCYTVCKSRGSIIGPRLVLWCKAQAAGGTLRAASGSRARLGEGTCWLGPWQTRRVTALRDLSIVVRLRACTVMECGLGM